MKKYCINSDDNLINALKQLNRLKSFSMTLLVLDNNQRVLGTLTDGDIRRALINGKSRWSSVKEAMNEKFGYLQDNKNIPKLSELRKKRITLIPVLDRDLHLTDIIDLTQIKSKIPIDAVLMAGGKGERLRPLTEKTPKPLLKIGDKCIIDYNIDHLIDYGVNNIYVTVNYLGEQLEEHFSNPRNGIFVRTIREPKFLGTLGSIKFVETFKNDVVLVMNSDLFTNINFEDMYRHFQENNADMSVAAVPYVVSVPLGIFELDGRNIKGVTEKPTYNYYANAGIYLIRRKLIESIPDDTFYNATDFMEQLIANGYNVIRYPITGYWIDIGKPEEFRRAQDFVKHLK